MPPLHAVLEVGPCPMPLSSFMILLAENVLGLKLMVLMVWDLSVAFGV